MEHSVDVARKPSTHLRHERCLDILQHWPPHLLVPHLHISQAAVEILVGVQVVAAHDHARPVLFQRGQALLVLPHELAVLEYPHVPRARDRTQHGRLSPELEEIAHACAERLPPPEDGEVQVARQPDGPGRDAVLVGREGEVEHAAPAAETVHPQGAHEREGPAHPDGAVRGRERQVHRRLPRDRGPVLHKGLRRSRRRRRAVGLRACACIRAIASATSLHPLRGGRCGRHVRNSGYR
mmetsp:Transcript_1230/g.3128  ORF Transcript_1230/g.3128 Transcript_1230/m.3128 type:complete len:238 (+) Transcript_1230:736-1449(+)